MNEAYHSVIANSARTNAHIAQKSRLLHLAFGEGAVCNALPTSLPLSLIECFSERALMNSQGFGIGDVYFLALSMGKCEVIVDEVKRLSEGRVHLESGSSDPDSALIAVF